MRVIKFALFILLILILGYLVGWYYITNKIVHEINTKYVGKKFTMKGVDKEDYALTFGKATPNGFPFEIAIAISDWKEENKGAEITYSEPIYIGYSLFTQKIFISYTGDIKASYKPVKHGFGSKLRISDYLITIDLPLNKQMFNTILYMKDPFELVNHFGSLSISTKRVQVFDLLDGEKFYDKEYERLKISFIFYKKYLDLNDFLAHIPQQYSVYYIVKTNKVNAEIRRLPVSLFYGFGFLPSDFEAAGNVIIKTSANTIKELALNLDIKGELACNSPNIDLPFLKFEYKRSIDAKKQDFRMLIDSKIKIKEGLFDAIFRHYIKVRKLVKNTALIGEIINSEIEYIISNKEVFRFKQLENSSYDFNLNLDSSSSKDNIHLKIENFSIFSEESGVRFVHESNINLRNSRAWNAQGILYIKNYPTVVDFISAYIYRFGQFKFLSDEARELYVDVNTDFLKEISDHPDSTANDISLEYKVDLNHLNKTAFGSVRFEQIATLYKLALYKKLLVKVGSEGDIFAKMKKIVPSLDGNEPILKKIINQITNIQNTVPDSMTKKKVNKDLWNNLIK